jgi:hypothetical protein
MATVAADTSFKIPANGVALDITEAIGTPATGISDISLWLGSAVSLVNRQSNYGTSLLLMNYIKNNWAYIAASGGVMVFHVDQNGTNQDVEVNGTPGTDQIRIELGDTVYTEQNSNWLTTGVDYLLDYYLEASKGN